MAEKKKVREDRFAWSGGQVVWDKPIKKNEKKTVSKPAKKKK